MICLKCGKYGHKESECTDAKRKPMPGSEKAQGEGSKEMNSSQAHSMHARADVSMVANDPTVQIQGEGSKGETMHEFGPWMIAQNRNRNINKGKNNDYGKNDAKGIERIKKTEPIKVSEGRDVGNGSRFALFQKSNEFSQEGKKEADPAVIFTGVPQKGSNVASTSRVRNAGGEKTHKGLPRIKTKTTPKIRPLDNKKPRAI